MFTIHTALTKRFCVTKTYELGFEVKNKIKKDFIGEMLK